MLSQSIFGIDLFGRAVFGADTCEFQNSTPTPWANRDLANAYIARVEFLNSMSRLVELGQSRPALHVPEGFAAWYDQMQGEPIGNP